MPTNQREQRHRACVNPGTEEGFVGLDQQAYQTDEQQDSENHLIPISRARQSPNEIQSVVKPEFIVRGDHGNIFPKRLRDDLPVKRIAVAGGQLE